MDKIKINDLFELQNELIAPIFDGVEYPWEVLPRLKAFLLDLIERNPMGYRELAPGVLVAPDVSVSPMATICPPAVICEGAELRPGAYIRGSVFVGRGAVVGNSCELKNCILLDKASVNHFSYVGDSVLGNRAHLGGGAICSNLKTDRTNVVVHGEADYPTGLRKLGAILADTADIGAQAVLNPGVVIGKGSSVYPLTSVRGVIPADRIVKSPTNIVIKEKR